MTNPAGKGSAVMAPPTVGGSLVALLMWVYYSSQLFFFGAEFRQVYARCYGSLRDARPLAPPA